MVAKTTSLKKSHVGLTFVRESDIWDKSFTERAPKLGGLIEFYRSPARVQWTPTGVNVPDYPKLAQLWWQNIGDASSGAKTPQAAMDALAAAQDSVLERLEKSGVQGACGPKLNPKQTAEYWYRQGREGRHHRAAAQAREREAQGRDGRLRHADQVVAGDAAEALGIEAPQAAALGKGLRRRTTTTLEITRSSATARWATSAGMRQSATGQSFRRRLCFCGLVDCPTCCARNRLKTTLAGTLGRGSASNSSTSRRSPSSAVTALSSEPDTVGSSTIGMTVS